MEIDPSVSLTVSFGEVLVEITPRDGWYLASLVSDDPNGEGRAQGVHELPIFVVERMLPFLRSLKEFEQRHLD